MGKNKIKKHFHLLESKKISWMQLINVLGTFWKKSIYIDNLC